MNCETCQELLSAFEANDLDAETASHVRGHLRACLACAGLLAAIGDLDVMTANLPDDALSRSLCLGILGEVDALLAPDLSEAPEIMTVEQLARFLRVPLARLEQELDRLPAFEVGGALRFRKEAVMEWIEERERDYGRTLLYSRRRAV